MKSGYIFLSSSNKTYSQNINKIQAARFMSDK